MSTAKKAPKKSDGLNKLIELCAKNNVKTLKQDANGVYVEFFPRSPEQLQQPFHQPLVIDNKKPPVPAHLEKEYKELLEADEKEMAILEDPSRFEEDVIREILGDDNNEE